MKRTNEEQKIIAKVLSGIVDGQVGKDFFTDGGSTVWTMIQNGRITRYKQGPGKRFFNGKENEFIEGTLHVLQEWITEDEILSFIQKFGFLMDDLDIKAYSAKFKPRK